VPKTRTVYMTTQVIAEHLFGPIRRIRIELGDPALGRQSDDAWLNNEIRRMTWRMEDRRRERRRSTK